MGGEKPKKSGERGEYVAEKFLQLIGWENTNKGIDIPCLYSEKHAHKKSKKGQRESHGIDFIFKYICPLEDQLQQNILVSVKNNEEYPSSSTLTNKFKEHFIDLASALECFSKSENSCQIFESISKIHNIGVLMWFDETNDKDYSIIDKIEDFRIGDITFDTIYLVDNKTANFIWNTINYIKINYQNSNCKYFYNDTSFNNINEDKSYGGKILPVEYINSPILPIWINEGEQEILFFAYNSEFSKENFRRMIGLSQKITRTLTNKIIIAYSDYKSSKHKDDISSVKQEFKDLNLVNKITVVSINSDLRTQEG